MDKRWDAAATGGGTVIFMAFLTLSVHGSDGVRRDSGSGVLNRALCGGRIGIGLGATDATGFCCNWRVNMKSRQVYALTLKMVP